MKVAYANPNGNWHKDHPTGSLVFQYLLTGEPSSPDNFMLILARQDKDFSMPRHRHNFDQIRLSLCGAMNLGQGMVLREGQVGYFPEGLPYGPQEDPLGAAKPGERLQLALQFGGASGSGFMSMEQRKAAWSELEKVGHFDGPRYIHPDGKAQWGLNAVWEHVFGEKLRYPKPRYTNVIIADPERFYWLPVAGWDDVHRKYLGSFSERALSLELLRIRAGAKWSSKDPVARRLFYTLEGEGNVNGDLIRTSAAIQIDAGEHADITAGSELKFFVMGLPPVMVSREGGAFDSNDAAIVEGSA